MRNISAFAVSALIGAASAQTWGTLYWGMDQYYYYGYYEEFADDSLAIETYTNSAIGLSSGYGVKIEQDRGLFLHNQQSVGAFTRPSVRGGAFEANVDVSEMECGCYASAYLVDQNLPECSPTIYGNQPDCRAADIFLADKYHLTVNANPCLNDECDEVP